MCDVFPWHPKHSTLGLLLRSRPSGSRCLQVRYELALQIPHPSSPRILLVCQCFLPFLSGRCKWGTVRNTGRFRLQMSERERDDTRAGMRPYSQFISLSVCWGVVLLGVAMVGRIMKHGREFHNNWNPPTTVGSRGWSDVHFLNSLHTLHAAHLFLLNRGIACTVCTRNHAPGFRD